MSALRLREGLTIRPLPDGDAVVATADGDTAVIVNAAACAILEFLADMHSEGEIVDFFCESFPDQDPATLREDVARLVADLVRAEIVEQCGAVPSTA